MKRDRVSIKWKLFFYFMLFTAIMLLLLWLFQVVFLDGFYKAIKTQNLKDCGESIAQNVTLENFEEFADAVSEQNDTCIRIVDENLRTVYSAEASPGCKIHKLSAAELYSYWLQAKDMGGTLFSYDEPSKESAPPPDFFNNPFMGLPPPMEKSRSESMVLVRLRDTGSGTVMIMLGAVITPVTSTVETLRIQLIIVTVILLLLTVGLSALLSRKVSRPIIKINRSAKELGRGNYGVAFEGKGYLEVSELSDTLNFAARELSKVEELRRELIANISHDLRTPLTMIQGYGEVMRDLPGENTAENIQIIIDEASRLSTLVSDLLDISKLQSGTQTLNLQSFNLTKSVKNILKRYQKLCEQDGYRIDFIHDRDIFVEGDELKISQVIYNLINNAVNYTGESRRVTVRQVSLSGGVRIEVTDYGSGIEESALPYIWDRYYKVDKAHKSAVVGTGLGLSIVKSVLELHKARYGAQSREGVGSTFWFELKEISYD